MLSQSWPLLAPRSTITLSTALAPAYAASPSPPSVAEIEPWITQCNGSRPRMASMRCSSPSTFGVICASTTSASVSPTNPKAAGLTLAAPWTTMSTLPNRAKAALTAS
jgi:hypothetical protein